MRNGGRENLSEIAKAEFGGASLPVGAAARHKFHLLEGKNFLLLMPAALELRTIDASNSINRLLLGHPRLLRTTRNDRLSEEFNRIRSKKIVCGQGEAALSTPMEGGQASLHRPGYDH